MFQGGREENALKKENEPNSEKKEADPNCSDLMY